MLKPVISLVLPVYNEQDVLAHLFVRLGLLLEQIEMATEVLFVNDGSCDRSLEMLLEQSRSDARYKVINLSRNFGHQIAVTAGIEAARGDAIIVMDADLQDPPEVALDMIAKWREGFDVVSARRTTRLGETWFKRKSAQLYYRLLQYLSPIDIPEDVGDFRLINRKVADALNSMPEQDRYIRGMISWIGFRQTEVLFERDARVAGESKYRLSAMLRLASSGILGFSDVPLRIVLCLGAAISMLAFAGIVYVLVGILLGGPVVPGWASVVVLFAFLSGVQLLTLGVIGLYIGRIYNEAKGRPLYFVMPEEDMAEKLEVYAELRETRR